MLTIFTFKILVCADGGSGEFAWRPPVPLQWGTARYDYAAHTYFTSCSFRIFWDVRKNWLILWKKTSKIMKQAYSNISLLCMHQQQPVESEGNWWSGRSPSADITCRYTCVSHVAIMFCWSSIYCACLIQIFRDTMCSTSARYMPSAN